MRVFEFLEYFDVDQNVVIYDKESQAVLYRGCVADATLRVCSRKNVMPNVAVDESTFILTIG